MNSIPTSEFHSTVSTVDGFPCAETDEDYALQMLIASDMENARSLQVAFETDPQRNSTAWELRNRPTAKKLYPNLIGAEPRGLLMALIRRVRWNAAGPETGWVKIISEMINHALRQTTQLTEAEFTSVAGALADMHRIPRLLCLTALQKVIDGLEIHGNTSADVIRGIRTIREHHRANWPNQRLGDPFLWPLFQANGILPNEAPWATRVRGDIGETDARLIAIFDAESYSFEQAQPTKRALIVVAEIGTTQLHEGLRRWVSMLREAPALSEIDATILCQVILLIDGLAAPAAEELLWEIARAPWKEDAGWVETLLKVINRYVATGRSASQAFACVEALSMNPAIATDEVLDVYHSILSAIQAEGTDKGADGFPFDSDPSLAGLQRRIDKVLRICAEAVSRGPYIHPQIALLGQLMEGIKPEEKSVPIKVWQAQMTRPRPYFDPGPDVKAAIEAVENRIYRDVEPGDLFYATFHRADWIAAHEGEFSQALLKAWRHYLHGSNGAWGMRRWALDKLDSLPLPWLLRVLQDVPDDLHIIELCRRHVAEHGWHVDLVDGMRNWVRALETSATVNLDRARIEWFLWFENVAPIRTEECWSYRIKQDLRQMKPKLRAGWIKLLDNPSFTVTAKPPQKWLKSARASFSGVGMDEFRRGFVEWFEPFAIGTPLRLTVCGRNMLRGLIWLTLVAGDPTVDETLRSFSTARWKTKEQLRRAAQAEMAFAHVLAERAPEGAEKILEAMLTSRPAGAAKSTEKALQQLRNHLALGPPAE